MGSAIGKVREEVTSASADKKFETESLETLNALETIANDHINAFYEKIENSANDAKEIPIDRVLTKHMFVRSYHKTHDNLGEAIKKGINDFASGPVATGLADLAESVFQMLLGASVGQRALDERYVISLGDCLGLSRLDICFFAYTFQSQSLFTACESVLASCVVVSSAKIDDINENTIRVLVNNGFSKSTPKIKNLICDEIIYRVIRRPSPAELQEDFQAHKIALKDYQEEMDDAKRRETARAKTEISSAMQNNASAAQSNAEPVVQPKGGQAPLLDGGKNQKTDAVPPPTQK